jgi:hypothetical protein
MIHPPGRIFFGSKHHICRRRERKKGRSIHRMPFSSSRNGPIVVDIEVTAPTGPQQGDSEMPHPISFLVAAAILLPAAAGSTPAQAAPRMNSAIASNSAPIVQVDEDRTQHHQPGNHYRHGQHRQQGYFYNYSYNPHYSYSPHYHYSPHAYQYYFLYPRPGFAFQYCSSGVCFGF